ncbi:CRISPR-associated endoribonuclease Cas6 [Intestinibacter bartlettii]|uniref:CRISPR-associated endoribonuclease Cas6 n=1 Tax=Intestinibacter bartlettii TaxID=261299 RepID=A0ABS6DZ69_9FIRM|nr:CRISPR-associated endoribonuclease Cas6 [Intestinibacter bartlettii]MBU5336693.1 CRISPR-associated endoribonuclease Cas6 [Intestinibacter bartlettii]
MQIIQIRVKVLVKEDTSADQMQSRVCGLIDYSFSKRDELLSMHNMNKYKFYCFDSLYPVESDRIYKKGKVYALTIRTLDLNLAEFFSNSLLDVETYYVKALSSEIKIIPQKPIEKIYSLTPAIIKNDSGYWRDSMSIDDYERRLKENLIKKYNDITGEKMDEDFELFNKIELKNRKPISVRYKNIKLLGDKVNLYISDDKRAQQLAYMALGSGIMEMNSRGCGFVNYKFL